MIILKEVCKKMGFEIIGIDEEDGTIMAKLNIVKNDIENELI